MIDKASINEYADLDHLMTAMCASHSTTEEPPLFPALTLENFELRLPVCVCTLIFLQNFTTSFVVLTSEMEEIRFIIFWLFNLLVQ